MKPKCRICGDVLREELVVRGISSPAEHRCPMSVARTDRHGGRRWGANGSFLGRTQNRGSRKKKAFGNVRYQNVGHVHDRQNRRDGEGKLDRESYSKQ